MLKNRDLTEVLTLFELSTHPDVFPYVRHKAHTVEEFHFITKQLIEAEYRGELISRTITNELQQPIGTISLFDIYNQSGFLATWIGQAFFGKGYNQQAKQLFLQELFLQLNIETVFMKIRKENARSLAAITKVPYISLANFMYPHMYNQINSAGETYDLLAVTKEQFLNYHQIIVMDNSNSTMDVEVVS